MVRLHGLVTQAQGRGQCLLRHCWEEEPLRGAEVKPQGALGTTDGVCFQCPGGCCVGGGWVLALDYEAWTFIS